MRTVLLAFTLLASAAAQTISTGNPDGLMAVGSRPGIAPKIEIEAGDDFILEGGLSLSGLRSVVHGTFTGLLTGGATISNIGVVTVQIYRVFPNDSVNPPSGNVPTRVNSPADNEFDDRSTSKSTLTFSATLLNPTFTAANSVLNGINKVPNQTTGGEGPVTGQEVQFDVTFNPPFDLPAPDLNSPVGTHYFFVPQVQVTGGEFMWLSAPRPIVSPGISFAPDLQAWIRNANLDPDWLRIGTDIVGGSKAPTFNMTFTLDAVFESSDLIFLSFFFN